MKPHPKPEVDAALAWAARLLFRLATISKDDLKEAWEGAEGKAHRGVLKKHLGEALRQLADHVKQRAIQLREGT